MTSLPVTRPARELPAGPGAALVVATSSYIDAKLTQLGAAARDAMEKTGVWATRTSVRSASPRSLTAAGGSDDHPFLGRHLDI
jgi:hypothetical protein